jgi:hypothetical protein
VAGYLDPEARVARDVHRHPPERGRPHEGDTRLRIGKHFGIDPDFASERGTVETLCVERPHQRRRPSGKYERLERRHASSPSNDVNGHFVGGLGRRRAGRAGQILRKSVTTVTQKGNA